MRDEGNTLGGDALNIHLEGLSLNSMPLAGQVGHFDLMSMRSQ